MDIDRGMNRNRKLVSCPVSQVAYRNAVLRSYFVDIINSGSHQLLGPSWKKGFLDGRSASRPEGSTINNRNVEKDQATKADSDIQSTSTESAQAFRDIVIEKSVTVGHNTLTRRTSAVQSAAAPSSVSRFKARRQGLQ